MGPGTSSVTQLSAARIRVKVVLLFDLDPGLPPSACSLGAPASSVHIAASALAQVIAATNRVDILDPALLRSGRLDQKIEFPMPNEEARARIMQIHSRKMNVR